MLCFYTYIKFLKPTMRIAAADFTSFLTNLEPDSLAKSETVEVTTTPPQPSEASSLVKEEVKLPNLANDKKGKGDAPVIPGWDKLIHLTDDNYKILFLEHKHLFIMFHADWCSYCKDMKPMFADIAANKASNLVTLAAADADLAPKLVDHLMIVSLPTFKYVKNGEAVSEYAGERTAAGILDFLQSLKITNKDEL